MLHLLEIASVGFLFVYMFFAYKRKAIAWIFGIIGSVLSAILFFKNGFLGSMFLNIIYALQGFLGYFEWKWKSPSTKPQYHVKFKLHSLLIASCLGIAIGLEQLFLRFSFHEFKLSDLSLALFSILATFLEIKKDISCWWYWIVCNLGYAYLYLNIGGKDEPLYLYALLMIVLSVFSWFAQRAWLSELKAEN